MALIFLSCAWVAGIFLGSKFSLPPAIVLTSLIPLPLLLFIRHRHKIIILTSLCFIALFAGALRFQSSIPAYDESCLHFYNGGKTLEIRGIVDSDPDIRDKTTHLRLKAIEIKPDNQWHEVSGSVLLFVPRYPAYRYGDMLLVRGTLETPRELSDFDYKDYLAHQGIYSTMLYPKIEIIERGKGFKPLEWIYSLRSDLSRTLAEVLPEPQASLAQGIILGIRGNIPPDVNDAFSHTGTAHLLAISGLNLSILAGILLSIGIRLFGRRHYIYIWLALGTIWVYTLLTGTNPPVVRGAIMASLFLTAELLGRQRSAVTSITLAAAVMAGISPRILWDASFQLSFLAMTGLIFIAPVFMTMGRKGITAIMGDDGAGASTASIITDSISVSLGAVLAVWPAIAYYFGIISFASLPATLLTLPALPYVIISGVLAGALGFISLPVAQAVSWLSWLFISYTLWVVNGFASIPLSSLEISAINPNLAWTYYLLLLIVFWLRSYRRQVSTLTSRSFTPLKSGTIKITGFISGLPKKWVIPPLSVLAILVWLTVVTIPDDNLHISFLDVGQGDAVLISRGTQQVLVDGGPSPQAINLILGNKMPFWDRTIDLLILTHPHGDHVTGLVEVLDRYRVRQALYPELDFESDIYQEWLSLIREMDIKCTPARSGQLIDMGKGAVLEVLNPQETMLTGTRSDIDNNSVVLRLSINNISFLLTADIMQEAELELITRRANLSSTVLKVAHNGSDTSTSDGFLAVVNPQVAVISVGKDNPYGHPVDDVVARLEKKTGADKTYRTDEQGTIEFITDGEKLWVRPER